MIGKGSQTACIKFNLKEIINTGGIGKKYLDNFLASTHKHSSKYRTWRLSRIKPCAYSLKLPLIERTGYELC